MLKISGIVYKLWPMTRDKWAHDGKRYLSKLTHSIDKDSSHSLLTLRKAHKIKSTIGFKITADGDCSHEIKRCLLLGRKAMTNLDSILKSKDITLSTKVCLIRAMVFPVVMYGCESLTIKKAEHWRIDAFELWCWRRFFRVLWTARRSNQSWIFIGRTDTKAEAPILWPPDEKNWLIGKTLMLRKIEGGKKRGWQKMRWLNGITHSMDMSLSKL